MAHTRTPLLPALLLVVLLCALAACKRRETAAEFHARAERLNRECREAVGDDFVYRTAAGFRLAIPKYASGALQPSAYGEDCRLQDIRLVLAWVDGKLIPAQQGGLYRPAGLVLPERYDTLVVMMSFRPPARMARPEQWDADCRGSSPQHDYPAYKLRMCPRWNGKEQRPLATLPYRPRFQILNEKFPPYSFSCHDEDFDQVTLETVTQAAQPDCRGDWYWRPGAGIMFDLHVNKGLQQAHLILPAAENLLDAWIVPDAAANSRP